MIETTYAHNGVDDGDGPVTATRLEANWITGGIFAVLVIGIILIIVKNRKKK